MPPIGKKSGSIRPAYQGPDSEASEWVDKQGWRRRAIDANAHCTGTGFSSTTTGRRRGIGYE